MTWTYRIIKDTNGGHRIAEVYTGDGPTLWTAAPMAAYAESLDELRGDLTRMLNAFDHPVLDEATLRETVASETAKR